MGSVRERLVELAQIRTKEVELSGEKVLLRELTAAEFGEYGLEAKKDRSKAVALLISMSVVDETGKPILTLEDGATLAKSARMSIGLVSAIMDLNGFGDTEKEPVAN